MFAIVTAPIDRQGVEFRDLVKQIAAVRYAASLQASQEAGAASPQARHKTPPAISAL